jgi:hypothetical protein
MSEELLAEIRELRAQLHSLQQYVQKVANDHEHRLRELEQWRWSLPPTLIAAMVAAVASILSAVLR